MSARGRRLQEARRYALIGAFVLGAALVGAVALATFFGGGFGHGGKTRALMVFRSTVTGLEVGTPVQFRGIKIGEVREIRTLYDPGSRQVQFAVVGEFSGTIEVLGEGGQRPLGAEGGAWIREMIERGLRAQLQTRSFVTGQQMIMLDFAPDSPKTLARLNTAAIEIPTMRSSTEELSETLREVPVAEVIAEAQRLMMGIDRLVNGQAGEPGEVPAMLEQVTRLAASLERTAPKMVEEVSAAARDARGTLAALTRTVRTVERRVDDGGAALAATAQDARQLAERVQATLASTERLMARLEQTAARVDTAAARLDHTLSEDSPVGAGLTATLGETAAAARALRSVAEGLYRKPDALLFGRSQPARAQP